MTIERSTDRQVRRLPGAGIGEKATAIVRRDAMKARAGLLLAGIALAGAVTAVPADAAAYLFHDEFSGTALDTAVWTARTGSIGGACQSADDVSVSGGNLRMAVHRGTTTKCPWVGGRVISQDKRYLDYGLVQARVKWNAAPGFWGGFVLFGRASGGTRLADGEIDTEITKGTVHYRLWSVDAAGKRCGVALHQPNGSLGQWHTFGIDRQSTYTRFFLDGVRRATITKAQLLAKGCTWPFTRRFSLALSATAGGWGGTPDPSKYPVTTLVDWVRQ
jgi:beta-glucanase (GH16 family)